MRPGVAHLIKRFGTSQSTKTYSKARRLYLCRVRPRQKIAEFASWLGLCPGNKVSGGKRLSGRSKPSANRAAAALRLSASSLYKSSTALGTYLRRLKARLDPAKAITATAHKLAKIIYNMLRNGIGYKESGQEYYEQQYRDRVIKGLQRKAQSYGFSLVEKVVVAT